jgi:hypothetical protein
LVDWKANALKRQPERSLLLTEEFWREKGFSLASVFGHLPQKNSGVVKLRP